MVKLVVAVRSTDERSTNTFLEVEDGTGMFSVKVFSGSRDDGSGDGDCTAIQEMRQKACQDNKYVRIIGQVREFDGGRTLIANDIRLLDSGDQLTHHFLEVAHSYEKHLKRKSQQGQGMFGGGMMGYGIGNAASGGGPQASGANIAQQGGNMGGGSAINDAILSFFANEGRKFNCCAV